MGQKKPRSIVFFSWLFWLLITMVQNKQKKTRNLGILLSICSTISFNINFAVCHHIVFLGLSQTHRSLFKGGKHKRTASEGRQRWIEQLDKKRLAFPLAFFASALSEIDWDDEQNVANCGKKCIIWHKSIIIYQINTILSQKIILLLPTELLLI